MFQVHFIQSHCLPKLEPQDFSLQHLREETSPNACNLLKSEFLDCLIVSFLGAQIYLVLYVGKSIHYMTVYA